MQEYYIVFLHNNLKHFYTMKTITIVLMTIVTIDVIYTYYYYNTFNALYISSVYILSGVIFHLIHEKAKLSR